MQAFSLQACGTVRSRPHRSTEADLCFIARRLGLVDFEQRTIIAKVRALARNHFFPLPKNPRFVNGVRILGANAIHARSIWDRDAVERWLEDDRPPAESAAVAAARRANVRLELGRRAAELVVCNG